MDMDENDKRAYAEHLLREALIYAMDQAGVKVPDLVAYTMRVSVQMRRERELVLTKEKQNG
jgi:hypothetical protein